MGAWAGLIPFIGPSFDYSLGSDSTWDWFANRLWLSVLPAVAAVIGGILLVTSRTRAKASLGGLLALGAGLWLIVGPSFSMLWEHGNLGTGQAFGSTGDRFLEWIGYFYGTGALITLFAAYILGFLAALPRVEPAVAPAAAGTPVAGDATATATPLQATGTPKPLPRVEAGFRFAAGGRPRASEQGN